MKLHSSKEISSDFKEFEIRLGTSQIDRILKYKFYHGIMEYKGEEYPHRYETIITQELYNQVKEVREGYHKKSHHKYAGYLLYRED